MVPSVLGSVTLGYELIWDAKRQCTGVRLSVAPISSSAVDARHLLEALSDLWVDTAGALLLKVEATSLLLELLGHAPTRGVWIEVPDSMLDDAGVTAPLRQAQQRGWLLVWGGAAGQAPRPETMGCFHRTLRSLTPHEALDALRVSRRQQRDGSTGATRLGQSPVVAGSLYQGLPSQALVDHALDQQGVWSVVGWPSEEILHACRLRQVQPSHQRITILLKALEADASLETLEQRMGEEPLLTYRFLRYANSAHVGARAEVTNVRQGLMVMGYAHLRTWLAEQLPHSSRDLNLEPIRTAMVVRARIMEWLSNAGLEDELRREVFLCGVLSQLDLLLGEPVGAAIHHLPLPGRIASAVVGQTGPYAPWLQVAAALETGNTRLIRQTCKAHSLPADAVNRALLRALATL